MLVLWQVRSADYSNRTKRDEAWDLLVQLTREKIPEADLCFVKKKVDSNWAPFRKEMCRVQDSKRSGLSTDDVYSQHCGTSTCFCSRQTKKFLGKAKAIWRNKLKTWCLPNNHFLAHISLLFHSFSPEHTAFI